MNRIHLLNANHMIWKQYQIKNLLNPTKNDDDHDHTGGDDHDDDAAQVKGAEAQGRDLECKAGVTNAKLFSELKMSMRMILRMIMLLIMMIMMMIIIIQYI